MKWVHCFTRKGIFRLLTALLILACTKLTLFFVWSVNDVWLQQKPPAQQLTQEKDSQKQVSSKSDTASLLQGKQALAAEQQAQEAEQPKENLGQEWERLQQREQELQEKEQELQELEERVDQKLDRQEELKAELEAILDRAQEVREEKIKHLVDVYANMQPEQAATVLENLEQETAVRILAGMRGRTAGEILSFVEAGKAARLSEKLTDFQTPFDN